MKKSDISSSPTNPLPGKFGESLCAHHGVPISAFSELAWRLCSSRLTRCLRPTILFFAPRYFQSDDDCLSFAAECRRKQDLVDEVHLFHASYLRRGLWRHFGIGLSGRRILVLFDKVTAEQASDVRIEPGRKPDPKGQGTRMLVVSSE